jgi:PAS domain S-box-containing protein
MEDQETKSRKKTALRRRAEEELQGQEEGLAKLTPEKIRRLVHERRVHQVELEIQNEELRQTQVRLEESRSSYSDLYDFAPVSYFSLDDSGRILEANLTAASLLGVERGNLIGKIFLQFVVRDDSGVFNRFLPQVLASQTRQSCEVRLKGRFGELVARLDGLLWRDAGGRTLLRVTATDISNLRAVERELRRHRDHLEQLVLERTASLDETVQKLRHEMAERRQAEAEIKRLASFPQLNPSPTLEIDATGAITYYNQAAVAAVEKAGGEARLTDFLPEDLEEIQTAARQGGEKSYYREISFAHGVFAEHIHFAEPFDVLRIYGVDITPRRQAEDALQQAHDELEQRVLERTTELRLTVEQLQFEVEERLAAEEMLKQSEARFRTAFDQSPVGAVIVDQDLRFQRVNPAFCRIIGYTAEELASMGVADISYPEDLAKNQQMAGRFFAGELDHVQIEERNIRKDGTVIWIDLAVSVINPGDRPSYFLGIVQDITARKEAERLIQRQSDILAGINRIFRRALACETEVELDRTCLAVMLGLSGAEFGVIYELNANGRLDATTINDEALTACRMGTVDLPKNLEVRGLYRGVIQEKQSLLTNDPASHPDSIGVPQGHIPLTSFLGVPLVQGEAVMGLVGLGNKAGGFEPADQEMAETLSVAIAEALTRLRTERRETSISRLYRVLSKVNEAIVRAQDRETLFGQICRVMVEEGRFKMAWIGLVDQEEGLVKAVAQHGLDQGYLERIRIPLRKSPESLGPTGIAVREGKYDVCNDIANDPRMTPWREQALSRGYLSSGSFPLRVGSKVIGCLTMYAEVPGFFIDEEIGLLGNLALDVSFAIESLERKGQRRQAEEALKESEERLRYLASRLIDAQETEKKRLSLELHDDMGQILTVLKLQVREIDKGLPASSRKLRTCCEDLRKNLDEVIEKMRRLSRDLSPSILIDLGLPAALRHLTEEFTKYQDIKVSLKIGQIMNQFSPGEEINLYRIFQEALSNIVKHAQATRIEITIKKHERQVAFRVHDNGRGLDRDHILSRNTSSRGLGLTAIAERVRMLGGTLEISSHEGKGTSITFVVPVRK